MDFDVSIWNMDDLDTRNPIPGSDWAVSNEKCLFLMEIDFFRSPWPPVGAPGGAPGRPGGPRGAPGGPLGAPSGAPASRAHKRTHAHTRIHINIFSKGDG